ncbi:MAG TPA: LON peptidase substrate-binding domain-containing protein [Acidimicrobiales bacterium]|nr:LON peptidase substrate-binding domain-containing protein [Acidimicrobiales bacterium]
MDLDTGAPGDEPLAMFPLSTVLLPGELLPLHVFEPRYRVMMAHCLERRPHVFGVVLISRGSEVGGGDTRTDVGTLARIETLSRSEDGRYGLLARGVRRLRVLEWMPDDPFPRARVEWLGDSGDVAAPTMEGARAAVVRVEALLSEMGRSPAPTMGDPVGEAAVDENVDPHGVWALCRRLPLGPADRQRLLVAEEAGARLEILTVMALAQAEDLLHLLAGG